MNSSIFKVAKREYIRIVKKRSFWLAILALPILYFLLGMVVGQSAENTEKKIAEEAAKATEIIIVDPSGVVSDNILTPPFIRSEDVEASRSKVIAGGADAVFYYPKDLAENKAIAIYVQQTNLLSGGRFDDLARNLLKQSILAEIKDPQKIALFNADLTIDKTLYQNGKEVTASLEGYIVPIVAGIIYFMLLILSGNFMLSSVAEEKENRMAETLLSIMTPKQLVWGKIIGLTGVAFTQVVALIGFGVVAIMVSSTPLVSFHIDWSAVEISAGQILTALFFIFTGFIFMASIMVGVGAAMPTQRETQQFSGIFIMLSIFPVYIVPLLLIDPQGVLSRVVSFFPFTASLILLLRNALNELPLWELLLGMAAVAVYVALGLYIAIQLFKLGSMEFSKKVSLRAIFRREK
ncbi:MAG: ABC transporter permease [Patescibacteria group bacterium]